MGTLTALVLATPIFGFALTQPSIQALDIDPPPAIAAASVSAPASAEVASPSLAAAASVGAAGVDQAAYVQLLRKRAKMAKVHRTMGIATWALTGVAVIAGTIQYRNLYGVPFSTEMADTPCVQGSGWPRQQSCYGPPWFHAITGFGAGGFYFTTLGLAAFMPDPDNAASGKSQFAKTLRTHKALRWVHLAGMLSQMVIGVLIANPGVSGLDRANDYDTLKALSGFHLFAGYVTLASLSWAGTIMLL
jgi:hypothetical protein